MAASRVRLVLDFLLAMALILVAGYLFAGSFYYPCPWHPHPAWTPYLIVLLLAPTLHAVNFQSGRMSIRSAATFDGIVGLLSCVPIFPFLILLPGISLMTLACVPIAFILVGMTGSLLLKSPQIPVVQSSISKDLIRVFSIGSVFGVFCLLEMFGHVRILGYQRPCDPILEQFNDGRIPNIKMIMTSYAAYSVVPPLMLTLGLTGILLTASGKTKSRRIRLLLWIILAGFALCYLLRFQAAWYHGINVFGDCREGIRY